jgi:hypothetical protein
MARKGNVKSRNERDLVERPERVRKYKYLFLIVCEDQNTEPTYFRSFKMRIPEDTIFLHEVGAGRDPKGVVEQALAEREALEQRARKTVDTIWVVFDKDDADSNKTKIKRFEDAFKIAGENGFRLAYSNEVFELWLLLHLTDVDPEVSLPRQEIYIKLETQIKALPGHSKFVYQHGDAAILSIIAEAGDEQSAIQRVEALVKFHGRKDPILSNPITHVQELLKDLYKWIAFYSWKQD